MVQQRTAHRRQKANLGSIRAVTYVIVRVRAPLKRRSDPGAKQTVLSPGSAYPTSFGTYSSTCRTWSRESRVRAGAALTTASKSSAAAGVRLPGAAAGTLSRARRAQHVEILMVLYSALLNRNHHRDTVSLLVVGHVGIPE